MFATYVLFRSAFARSAAGRSSAPLSSVQLCLGLSTDVDSYRLLCATLSQQHTGLSLVKIYALSRHLQPVRHNIILQERWFRVLGEFGVLDIFAYARRTVYVLEWQPAMQ